jgi:hypothetical protein
MVRDWLERKQTNPLANVATNTGDFVMSDFISNVLAVILGIVAVTIGLKVIFFLLGLVGIVIGLAAVIIKLAIFGGLLYLGWLFISKLLGHRRDDVL